jgi:cobalt/nickel transport system ATP-binding protein
MLSIHNLVVAYAEFVAVNHLSFDVRANENIALIGENGAGKTTLFHALTGILESKSGSIAVDGVVLTPKTLREIRRRVGLVFQNPDDQLFMPDVYADVAFGPRNYGVSEERVKAIVSETLRQLRIEHLYERSSLKLSGGEKRMAAIATVLVMDPSVLLLDEPTAFLDHKSRRALIQALNALPQTKIIATHDLPFAAATCERVIVMKNGAVFADGSTEILYDAAIMRPSGLEEL